ncbi:MAG: hypothetical protein ACM3Q1_17500 [Bacteroidales bacterium]
MYSDDDLNAAIEAGVMPANVARAFRDFVARRRSSPMVDEEHFRLLTGFNDIFVTVAAILVLVAVGGMGGLIDQWIGALAVAAASWGLAEYFTRRRRMALPSIVLLLSFVGGVFTLVAQLVDGQRINYAFTTPNWGLVAAGLVCGAATYAHWRRFRVPITVAAGTLTVAGGAVVFLFGRFDMLHRGGAWPLVLLCGLATFGFAMWWDAGDRDRSTRRSDVAFWLHLAAAPLIVHPVFSAMGLIEGRASSVQALVALLLYLGMAVVALMVDRRALLISALIYVLYAISTLLKSAVAVQLSYALTALVLGSALLLLSANWHKARAVLVRRLPAALQARLPAV